MVEVSKHAFRRSLARGWVDQMSFLIANQSGGEELSQSQRNTTSHQRTLHLSSRSALVDPCAYIAVSYCWDRKTAWSPGGSNHAFSISYSDHYTRPSAAPQDVLSRSIAYAEAHGINAIWIDQECINQNDPLDKNAAIQEMDLVYQDSDHPIAILEYSFPNQIELDVFSSICDSSYFTFDPSQINVLEAVLSALVDDKWFKRAWTLQESVSAGLSMTLLLGCPGLRKSPHFGPTADNIEISIEVFQNAMVYARELVEEGLAAGIWPSTQSAIDASNWADILWNFVPTIVPSRGKRTPSHRQKCNAAQALTFLDDRQNSVFSDKIAILANLCNYDRRINTKVLESPNSSFTICALTLAIINGDMSLLGCHRAQAGSSSSERCDDSKWRMFLAENGRLNGLAYENDDFDMPSNSYGFSWGPKPSTRLRNIAYLEEDGKLFRLNPSTLSNDGLRVCGILWNIDRVIQVPQTSRRFSSRWQEELAFQTGEDVLEGMSRQIPLIQEFLWSLLHELVESGCNDLARTLWNFVQPLGRDPISHFDSYELPPPFSYERVFDYPSQSTIAAGQVIKYDEHEVRARLSAPSLSFDPENEALDRPLLERLLIDQVCNEGALVCGTPVDPTQNVEQPLVWFEACELGEQIFTPVSKLGDGAARSRFRNQAMSWRVTTTGRSVDSCNILHCLGRRRGIWRVDGLHQRHYILD
ncbi:MAG: hypothetical protein Q9190_000817 [Brigantiaea leucoxantha]